MTRKWVGIACVVLLAVSLAGCVTDSGYYDSGASAQAASQARGYQGQGNVVSVDSATASPGLVSPGQQILLGMDYTILTPDNMPVSATLVREIRYQGNLVGSPYQTTVSNANGSFNDSVSYTLPNNATPGVYTVVSRLTSNYGTSQRETSFSVR